MRRLRAFWMGPGREWFMAGAVFAGGLVAVAWKQGVLTW